MHTPVGILPRPPVGGRVMSCSIHVPAFVSFEEAARFAGPQTPNDSSVWKAASVFADPVPAGMRDFVLMWAGNDSKTASTEAVVWGVENGLGLSSPYEVFALCGELRTLYQRCHRPHGCGFAATEIAHVPLKGRSVCGVWQSEKGTAWSSLSSADAKFYDRTIFVFKVCQR